MTPSVEPQLTRSRVPNLTGALNFRDLGGYATVDGRSVRWNSLYRSGTTHAMTQEDLAHLGVRGIRYAYDLRSKAERRQYPNKLNGVADIEYRFLDHDQRHGDIARYIEAGFKGPEQTRELMFSLYKKFPYDFRDAYRALFVHLANGDLPLVFNCTAGKDRTGVAAALILTALGVPRETVVDDYVLTEQFLERNSELILRGNGDALFAGVGREIWEPLMRADAAYLQVMFDQLTSAHGSVDQYLEEELGVTDEAMARIRRNLLD